MLQPIAGPRRMASAGGGAPGVLSPSTPAIANEDLTAGAWLDWLAYRSNTSGVNDDRRLGVNQITGPTLSNFTRAAGIGGAPLYSWTNGTTNPTGTNASETARWNVTSALSIGTLANTVPADTTLRTCWFDICCYTEPTYIGTAKLRVTLSDGSAAPLLLNIPKTDFVPVFTRFAFSYQAGAAGQTLTIQVEISIGDTVQIFPCMVAYK